MHWDWRLKRRKFALEGLEKDLPVFDPAPAKCWFTKNDSNIRQHTNTWQWRTRIVRAKRALTLCSSIWINILLALSRGAEGVFTYCSRICMRIYCPMRARRALNWVWKQQGMGPHDLTPDSHIWKIIRGRGTNFFFLTWNYNLKVINKIENTIHSQDRRCVNHEKWSYVHVWAKRKRKRKRKKQMI